MSFLNREVFWKPAKYELIPWLEDIARVTGLPPDFHAGSVAQFSPLSYLVASGMTNYGPWSLSNRRLELSMLATTDMSDMGWDFYMTCSVIRDEWSDRHILITVDERGWVFFSFGSSLDFSIWGIVGSVGWCHIVRNCEAGAHLTSTNMRNMTHHTVTPVNLSFFTYRQRWCRHGHRTGAWKWWGKSKMDA